MQRVIVKWFLGCVAAAAIVAQTGCARYVPALPAVQSDQALAYLSATGAGKIQHVVYVVQENRSFNDLFMGYPNATTQDYGYESTGKKIALQPIPLSLSYEMDHSADAMFAACNGTGNLPGTKCRMNGFDRERLYDGPRDGQYAYVPRKDTKPYWEMAQQYVLADRMFASQIDESFVAHQYVIAAQAHASVNVPSYYWGCPGNAQNEVSTLTSQRTYGAPQRPCFNYRTLGDELDDAGLPWRFYTSKYNRPIGGFWSAYQAVRHIYRGPDWKKDVITPQKRFLTDVAAGKLAAFTWVTPLCQDSDHTACGGGFGPSWVTSVVNAVGESKFWNTTAIFVQWDDWGGLYDPDRTGV